jgi:hypothetical protein
MEYIGVMSHTVHQPYGPYHQWGDQSAITLLICQCWSGWCHCQQQVTCGCGKATVLLASVDPVHWQCPDQESRSARCNNTKEHLLGTILDWFGLRGCICTPSVCPLFPRLESCISFSLPLCLPCPIFISWLSLLCKYGEPRLFPALHEWALQLAQGVQMDWEAGHLVENSTEMR